MGTGDAQPASKARAVVREDKEKLEQELTSLILTLQNSAAIRNLNSAVFHSALVKSDLIAESLTTAKNFAERTKGISGHKYGSPHVQIARTFIKSLMAKCASMSGEAEFIKLKEFLAEFEQGGPEQAAMLVAQLRVKQCKDKSTGVVMWALCNLMDPGARAEIDNAMVKLLKAAGAELKTGTAPQGDLERKLQKRVDEIREKLKTNWMPVCVCHVNQYPVCKAHGGSRQQSVRQTRQQSVRQTKVPMGALCQ